MAQLVNGVCLENGDLETNIKERDKKILGRQCNGGGRGKPEEK